MGADDAIEEKFYGGEIRGWGASVEVISEEVASNSHADAMRFVFLRANGWDNASIGDSAVWRYGMAGDEEDGVCA